MLDSELRGTFLAGMLGVCTWLAMTSLIWLLTGSLLMVSLVVSLVLAMYMLENIAFYEEIVALEGLIRVKDRKIENLKLSLADLTTIHDTVSESIKWRRRAHSLDSKSTIF